MDRRHERRSEVGQRTCALVLAAGEGARFGRRKQFVSAAGHRLVDLAVRAATSTCDRVVLVLPAGQTWDGPPVDAVVVGGDDRGASVRRGLDAIDETHGTVLIHQAANPLASTGTIRALLAAVDAGAAAAVPGLRPADLARRAPDGVLGEVIGRDDLVLVQTPAAFRLDVLRAAHARGGPAIEETTLVTACGFAVQIIPGDPRNLHVATPEDLEIVAALLTAARR
ncbi:IspD/TarI family cytidylyltransferase [Nitriliruptor alkaliphilus]|uniref:IspD/TarI family cytidylyltransferase n=1 Tax=Nitriliruptor alkaliphilus TaxID=427918 RepID=UPI0006971FC3|nr:2-C-methyl-D-erythritol 4-phosphate cytidylyltransferase [Nitriliruptor alkaliphilus]